MVSKQPDPAGKKQEKIVINSKSKMSVCLQLGIVLFTAALAGSGPATARATSGHASGVAVPFKGSVEGTDTYDVTNFPVMLIDTTTGGVATHLGRYTATAELTVNVVTNVAFGSAHFVAANGDSLYTTSVARGDPVGAPADLTTRVTETHTITGGTGRFAGASGSFTLVRLAVFTGEPDGAGLFATADTAGSFEGTIVLANGK
jgi:hypothetical protein